MLSVKTFSVGVKVDLDGGHKAAVLCFAMLHHLQQHLHAPGPPNVVQHSRQGLDRLIPIEGGEDQLAAGFPHRTFLHRQRGGRELIEELLVTLRAEVFQQELHRAGHDGQDLPAVHFLVARAVGRRLARLVHPGLATAGHLLPLHQQFQALLVASVIHMLSHLPHPPQPLFGLFYLLPIHPSCLRFGDLCEKHIVILFRLGLP
mmetsp:Transcript_112373/g.267891  ORF Transcript_112373/g.267891 Transcript_112373/m.267891 type:complete len:203 (+) Transcript_112373:482-1090(+)